MKLCRSFAELICKKGANLDDYLKQGKHKMLVPIRDVTDANHVLMEPYKILISKYKWMEKLRLMKDWKYFDIAKKEIH